jgi:hypothetical protein
MRWNPDKEAILRELAPNRAGAAEIARHLGCSVGAVYKRAGMLDVRIPRALSLGSHDAELRARWRRRLPKMKESLRAEIARF